MRFSLTLMFAVVSTMALAQEANLIPPRSQQTHGRARSVPDTASLTSLDEDNRVGVSDQLQTGEKIFVIHDGIWWYDDTDPTTPNANRVDGGSFSGNFIREFLGKIHNVTTAERTNAELISFPSGQSALLWDSTESKLYRADGNGFLISPTFTEIVTGGGGGSFDDFIAAGDTGPAQTIADGDTLTVAGGEGIDTIASATDTLTIDMAINTLPANGALTGNETVAIYNPSTLAHESILATNLPGAGGDTNFALNDLTLNADRLHDLNNFKVDITGNAITYLTLDSTLDESYLRAAGSHWGVTGDGVITFQGTGNDWKVEGSAGTAGQVITSNGPATPATWQDVGIAIEDEGAAEEPVAKKLNFVGAGVDATGVGGNEVTVTIPGGGGAALSNEDEGVEVDGAVVVQDFVGDGVTVTQTAAGEVEVNIPGGTANTLEYGEDLTAGDFIKIGADGKAYAVAATPIQSVDSITTTDWETEVTGSVSSDFKHIARIDDNRVAIMYRDEANVQSLVVADRAGGNTYSLGTPLTSVPFLPGMNYCEANGHLVAHSAGTADPTAVEVYSVSGTTLASVGSTDVVNRGSNARGNVSFLIDGETTKFFTVWNNNDGTMWCAITDITTPASPTIGTEVNLGTVNSPSQEYAIKGSRIEGNRYLISWEQSGNIESFVVDCDPVSEAHSAGPVFSWGSTASARKYDIEPLSTDTLVAVDRTGAVGVQPRMRLFSLDPVTRIISVVASYNDDWKGGSLPEILVISEDQFILAAGGGGGDVECRIYNVVGNSFTEIDSLEVTGKSTEEFRFAPALARQGGNSFAYLHGDGLGLSYCTSTVESLANLGKLAGTAEQTLTAGNVGIVKYPGEISSTQSGLVPGEAYFLTDAVSLTTTATDTRVGIAQSETKLNLDFDISESATIRNVTLGRTVFSPRSLSATDLTPEVSNFSYVVTSGNGDAITDFDYGGDVLKVGHILHVYVQDGDSLVHGAGTIKLAGAVNFAPSGTDGTITLIYSGPTDGWRQHGAAMTY